MTRLELATLLRDAFTHGTLEEFAAALALVHFTATHPNDGTSLTFSRLAGSGSDDEISEN